MQLRIKNDLDPLANEFRQLAVRLGDLTQVMGAIGSILESSTAERIARSKTAPDGTPWADWAESTRKRRTDANGQVRGSLLLQRGQQGGLLRTVTHLASQNSVIIGVGKHYGAYLQLGTRYMPARPFLGLSTQDYHDIDDLLRDWLAGNIPSSH